LRIVEAAAPPEADSGDVGLFGVAMRA